MLRSLVFTNVLDSNICFMSAERRKREMLSDDGSRKVSHKFIFHFLQNKDTF